MTTSAAPGPRDDRPTLLIVEDDPVHRTLVVGALRSIAAEVHEAADGIEAQEILQKEAIDIAITDLLMPKMSGLELIGWAKEHAPAPVWVILSAVDNFDSAVEAVRLGAFDFVTKPIDPNRLEASVRSAMRQRQLVLDKERLDRELRVALEASPNGALMVDGEGQILLVNREIERIFAYERDELIGQRVEVLVPEQVRDRHPEYRGAFLSDPSPRGMGEGRELVGLRKDGSEFPVEIGLNPVETETGIGVIASVADISQRKRIEDALRRASGTSRALAASIFAVVLVITAGALGVARLQEINEELARVTDHGLPLALEISTVHALQLEQDGLFERALRFAEERLGDAFAAGSETATNPRVTEVEYRRAIAEYGRIDGEILEHLERARELIDPGTVPAASPDQVERGEDEDLELQSDEQGSLPRALVAIRTLHRNSNQRAQAVIELLDAGEAESALELADEVGFQEKEVQQLVSEVLEQIQVSTDTSVANARAIYGQAVSTVVVLGVVAGVFVIVAGILAVRAGRLRRQAGGELAAT